MLDCAAKNRKFGFHPRCQNISLTHLCFADDIMIFTDGNKRSIEGVIEVFDRFAKYSGLTISLEKSKIFLAGVSETNQENILTSFSLANGQLPVRYLGLPLLPKRRSAADYSSLIEKIRNRIGSWTGRFLSYAGRLQLINSVIMSLANFWLTAFRLPGKCLKEIEKLCSAFLWSGPVLNNRKAKVKWADLCKPRNEGGLGIRPLKEVSLVMGLKLIWRITSSTSLWACWIQTYLIRKGSFWLLGEKSVSGSWMWRKILKLREQAKQFHKVEISNGKGTSFWYDWWSPLGRLTEVLGRRGSIDLGIHDTATVHEVLLTHRRRRHRVQILNKIEDEIDKLRGQVYFEEPDIGVWRHMDDVFKHRFSTKQTWELIRQQVPECSWSRCVWFKQYTPKYAIMTWITIQDRLQTGERMARWSTADPTCNLCSGHIENRQHLFFQCCYSENIWKSLVHGILLSRYTNDWSQIITILSEPAPTNITSTTLFLLRYAFQAAIHSIWWERNARKHGDNPQSHQQLYLLIDKSVRNKLIALQQERPSSLMDGLQVWFSSREPTSSTS